VAAAAAAAAPEIHLQVKLHTTFQVTAVGQTERVVGVEYFLVPIKCEEQCNSANL
jgi:hypothetical protein